MTTETKLGKMAAYNEELPSIKSQDLVVLEGHSTN